MVTQRPRRRLRRRSRSNSLTTITEATAARLVGGTPFGVPVQPRDMGNPWPRAMGYTRAGDIMAGGASREKPASPEGGRLQEPALGQRGQRQAAQLLPGVEDG